MGSEMCIRDSIYWLLAREVLKVRGETTDEAWAEANDLEEWESTF